MKTILKTVTLVFIILPFASFSQSNDYLNREDLQIKKMGITTIFVWNENRHDFVDYFGSPTSLEPYYYEMIELSGYVLKYSGDEFYFINDDFDAFHLESDQFSIGLNGNFIKVGDPLSSLSPIYPDYINKKQTDYRARNFISIPLWKDGGMDEGAYFVIAFDPVTSKITGLHKYDY